jgi:hypothetical protein
LLLKPLKKGGGGIQARRVPRAESRNSASIVNHLDSDKLKNTTAVEIGRRLGPGFPRQPKANFTGAFSVPAKR